MNKPIYTYKYDEAFNQFAIIRRGVVIGGLDAVETTPHFMRWLVDLLNKNHEEFTKNRSEKLIKEMGF